MAVFIITYLATKEGRCQQKTARYTAEQGSTKLGLLTWTIHISETWIVNLDNSYFRNLDC